MTTASPNAPTVASALLQALKDHGATEIFGIPGDFALPFFNAVETEKILPLYLMSHEPGLGYAADAAARFNGKLGAVAVTYGAGAFNMVNAVAMAYAEKSPLVIISGAPGTGEGAKGLLLHHQAKTLASQAKVYSEITCDSAILDNPATAPQEIARVLETCLEQSRPVYIEFPRDMVSMPTEPVPPFVDKQVDQRAIEACASEIISRIEAATSPMILAGVEVRRYGLEAKVAKLATKLGLPIATSFMGRGMFADPDTPLVGTYFGVAGDPAVSKAVETSDALLLMGTIYSDCNFGVAERKIDMSQAIEMVDGTVRIGFHSYPTVPLKNLVDAMIDRATTVGEAARWRQPDYPHGLDEDDSAVEPEDVAKAVNDLFHRHGPMPMTSDVGVAHFTVMNIDTVPMAAPGYYASMGFAIPAALGVQAASGDRPLVLAGDGAFQMTGWELGNCQRYGWDPIVLVLNNTCWEMLRALQPQAGYNDLDDWRYAEIADKIGGDGVRVTTRSELATALEKAWTKRGRFQLIEVMIPKKSQPANMTQFISGIRKLSVLSQTS